jgi:polyisoprenoid-binding protein YceI
MKLVALLLAATVPAAAAGKTYDIDPSQSEVSIHVGKSGMFSFAGHEHLVVAPEIAGKITADPEALGGSAVNLTFQAKALKVAEKGEPQGDAQKVQTAMLSPTVLDAVQFPEVVFTSKSVSGKEAPAGTWTLQVVGDVGLHGVTKSLTLPVQVTVVGDVLTATGKFILKQTDFHMSPVSVAGVVKVKDEVTIDYKFVAKVAP